MNLQWCEGYISALKDIKKNIELEIERCEYALGESYSALMGETENESI